MTEQKFPSVRDIYYRFEYDNIFTGEFSRRSKLLNFRIGEVISSSSDRSEIESLASNLSAESQAMGFEQGFACAAGLVMLLLSEGIR